MKITKELFKSAYAALLEKGNYQPGLFETFGFAVKEEISTFRFPGLCYVVPSVEITDWVKEHILGPYGFDESFKTLRVDMNPTFQVCSAKQYDSVWVGANNMILLTGASGLPGTIACTEDAQLKVKKIFEEWYQFISPRITTEKKKTRYVSIMLHGINGFSEASVPLGSKMNIDITKNYMPSLPDTKIQEKIRSDRGGFLIFNGTPGTGKSSYLKYLMETMEDVNFIILDPNALQMGAEEFKNYLIQETLNRRSAGEDKVSLEGVNEEGPLPVPVEPVRQNTVFILEDAEKLLLKRSEITNPVNLSNILNITDGIIGDLVKVKFVCTFNCDLSELDPALLRKGRLLHKYEFPKLSGETLTSLLDELGVPSDKRKQQMSLAEIYGWDTDTGLSDTDKGRIGF